MQREDAGSPVLRETRWLALAIIPFLAVAFVILYGLPLDTARLFAWEIKPPMTAMMLGAAYAGGVWFFVRAVRAGRWDQVAVGFPAVGGFATILGVATFMHWDRFIHGNLSFGVWTVLYVVTPFLVFGSWWRQERADAGTRLAVSIRLPRVPQLLFAGVGIGMGVISLGLFVAPGGLGAGWPWPLTALTARVMSALFALPAIIGMGIGIDGRWSSARIVVEAQLIAVALILVAPLLHGGGIDTGSPLAWLFFGGLAVLELGLAALYATMERARRSIPGSAGAGA
jgi:hypothetical protein